MEQQRTLVQANLFIRDTRHGMEIDFRSELWRYGGQLTSKLNVMRLEMDTVRTPGSVKLHNPVSATAGGLEKVGQVLRIVPVGHFQRIIFRHQALDNRGRIFRALHCIQVAITRMCQVDVEQQDYAKEKGSKSHCRKVAVQQDTCTARALLALVSSRSPPRPPVLFVVSDIEHWSMLS